MSSPSAVDPVADTDVAQSFVESNVSLSHTDTEVSSGTVALGSSSSSISRADNRGKSGTDILGWKINPNTNIGSLTMTTYSGNSDNGDEVRVERLSDNTVIASDAPGLPGQTQTLDVTLDSGKDYAVYLFSSSGTLDVQGDSDNDATSSNFDLINGWGTAGTLASCFGFSKIEASSPKTSGSVDVSFSGQRDVFAWDVATFTVSEDGETVDVFLEEDQSGGWTEVAGPISRGDAIPADPSNDVRFRADISRTDTSNNPTLDSTALRWTL